MARYVHENGETDAEEYINSVTSVIGLIFGLIAVPFLLYFSYYSPSEWYLFSSIVYGITLILMYAVSTYYHASTVEHHKRILRIIDHSCIYLLIAGTYTPYTLGPLRDTTGIPLIITIWSIAAIGVCIKVFSIRIHRLTSLALYIIMGWTIVIIFPTVLELLPFSVFFLLFMGGAFYTLGTIFFLWESLPFSHSVWHLFVLAGSFCHYFSILDMVLHVHN